MREVGGGVYRYAYERGSMKTTIFLFCFVSAWTAFAGEPPAQFSSSAQPTIPITPAERQMDLLFTKRSAPAIRFGKSDFVMSGPIVAGLRKLPHEENLSLGRKFLRLPIIRLMVPGPMERPPGTGKYFAWRNDDSPLPWAVAASRPVGARWTDWRSAQPDCSLIQLHK